MKHDFDIQFIGCLDEGIEGRDSYYVAKSIDGKDFKLVELKEEMKERFCYESKQPGSMFCSTILTSWMQYNEGSLAIVVVSERYDI